MALRYPRDGCEPSGGVTDHEGVDVAQVSALCRGCGAIFPRIYATGRIPRYCSLDCRPRCDVDGCDKPRQGNVYCAAHRSRWKRYGDPLAPLVHLPNIGSCSVVDCDIPMVARDWCRAHYGRWQKYGDPLGGGPSPVARIGPCSVAGCDGPVEAKSWCAKHYSRWRAFGTPLGKKWLVAQRDALVPRPRVVTDPKGRAQRYGVEYDPTITKAGLRERDGDRCTYCFSVMSFEVSVGNVYVPLRATFEHVIPISRGGSHTWKNMVLACRQCNRRKGARTVEEWTPDDRRPQTVCR